MRESNERPPHAGKRSAGGRWQSAVEDWSAHGLAQDPAACLSEGCTLSTVSDGKMYNGVSTREPIMTGANNDAATISPSMVTACISGADRDKEMFDKAFSSNSALHSG